VQLPQPRARQPREPDPHVEFVTPPDFYDDDEDLPDRDKYDNYINLSSRPCGSPIAWWQAYRNEYPRLSKTILDLFAIPMMSAEYKRVFLVVKNLVTDRRMNIKENIIKAIYLLRYWYKEEGVI